MNENAASAEKTGNRLKKTLKIIIIVLVAAALLTGAVFAGIFVYGSSKAQIDKTAAIKIALDDANLDDASGVITKAHFGLEEGMFCYEVKLWGNGMEYEYAIHSGTGTIIQRDMDSMHDD